MTDSYISGLELLASAGIEGDEQRNRAAEVAPEFVRLSISFIYGELFARPGLDLRNRMIVAIASLTSTGGSCDALRQHVEAALHVGWSKAEIVEVIVQTSAHAGIPGALKALTDCHDLLAVKDPCAQSCDDEISETGQA